MPVYKYTSFETGYKILNELAIRITQPGALNDPYDCKPKIEMFLNNKLLYDLFLNNKNKLSSLIKNGKDLMRESHADSWFVSQHFDADYFSENIDQIKKLLRSKINKSFIQEKAVEVLMMKINHEIGIISLTTNPKSMPMWSHYSDSHRGIVIEFDDKNPLFKKSSHNKWDGIEKMRYIKRRPIVKAHFNNTATEQELLKFSKDLFFKKNKDWEYEDELRILKPLRGAKNVGETDREGYKIFLIPLPPTAIKSIIIGARMDAKNIAKLVELLKKEDLKNISVKQTELSKTTYSVKIKNYVPARQLEYPRAM